MFSTFEVHFNFFLFNLLSTDFCDTIKPINKGDMINMKIVLLEDLGVSKQIINQHSEKLKSMGVKDGDTIIVGHLEFAYYADEFFG